MLQTKLAKCFQSYTFHKSLQKTKIDILCFDCLKTKLFIKSIVNSHFNTKHLAIQLTFRLILIIPVSIDILLNSTVENISILSLNNLCMFETKVESK